MAVRKQRKKAKKSEKGGRPPLRDRVKDAYREAILDSAEVIFARDEYQAAKISDIAAEAGVSVGTLYNYFEGKEEIFEALGVRGRAEFYAALDPALSVEAPLERLEAILRVTLGFLEAKGALFAAYTAEGGSQGAIARGDEEEIESRERYRRILVGTLEEAVELGELRSDLPAATLAVALSGLMQGFVESWLTVGRTTPLVDSTPVILELFQSGATTRTSSGRT